MHCAPGNSNCVNIGDMFSSVLRGSAVLTIQISLLFQLLLQWIPQTFVSFPTVLGISMCRLCAFHFMYNVHDISTSGSALFAEAAVRAWQRCALIRNWLVGGLRLK